MRKGTVKRWVMERGKYKISQLYSTANASYENSEREREVNGWMDEDGGR
jgi:hypothetical protein